MKILGITLERLEKAAIGDRLEQFLVSGRGHLIATVNPEMLVLARRDREFHDLLVCADLRTVDGIGIVLVSCGQLMRTTGNDLVEMLVEVAERSGKRILIVGGTEGRAVRAADALRKVHPDLQVSGMSGGIVTWTEGKWQMDPDLLGRIRSEAPDILLVSFGHGKQERFLRDHLPCLPSVRIGIGVGGVVDFLSGDASRAPAWMRRIGLEWCWRLIREPRRAGRICMATVVFPILVIFDRLVRKPRL